jgi:acetyl esterase/lipase
MCKAQQDASGEFLMSEEPAELSASMAAPSFVRPPSPSVEKERLHVETCVHDEGVAYFVKLKAAGVEAELHVEPGAPHGFVSMLGLPEGRAAVKRAAEWLEPRW